MGETVAPYGLVACGTALGHAHFIEEHVHHRCAPVSKLENSLGCRWTLKPSGTYCPLASRSGRRISYVMRNPLWVFLAQPLRRVEVYYSKAWVA